MRIYPKRRYVTGAVKRQCDVCGFDFLDTELIKRWDGALVCKADYDPKPDYLLPHELNSDGENNHEYKADIDASEAGDGQYTDDGSWQDYR